MPYDAIFALLLNAFFSEMPKSAFLFNTDAQIGKIADFVFVFIHIPQAWQTKHSVQKNPT